MRLRNKIKSRKLSVPKRLQVLVITLAFLLIPVLTYFTLYITNQTSYFTHRNFRQLASIGVQVEQRIEHLKDAYRNAVANTVEKQYEAQLEARLREAQLLDEVQRRDKAQRRAHHGASSDSHSSPGAKQNEARRGSSDQSKFQQSLDALGAGFVAASDPPHIPEYCHPDKDKSCPDADENYHRDMDHFSSWKVEMEVNTGGETSWLVFSCEMRHFLPDNKVEPLWFKAKIKLDTIVNPLVGKRSIESVRGSEYEEEFDSIVIAALEDDSKNIPPQGKSEPGVVSKVIFQQGTPELDIDSLDNLPRADAPDKIIDFKMLSRSTSSADVRLADTNYKIYLQPLEIPVPTVSQPSQESQRVVPGEQLTPSDQGSSEWVICGLVGASHFRHQTWAFSYTLLITFAFVTALVALSWPFLKLRFIGPKDRLRLADVYFIAFALLIGSAILSFFMLFGLTYIRSEREWDDRLKTLSEEIASRFYQEVGSSVREINLLNQSRSERRSEEAQKALNLSETVPFPMEQAGILEDRTDILGEIKNDPYPYFTTAFWMDMNGRQRVKWTINHRTSKFLLVSDRDYFKKLMEGNFRELGGQRFWLEPINSRNTGAKSVVISKALDSKDPLVIAAIEPTLSSLTQTVIPAGFGFRVIDNSGHDPGDDGADTPGRVLFQSSESQQLGENFFEECDNNHSLRSLVFGRISDFVNVNYRGEGHRLYVHPIEGFPNWSLVVFRNKQPLRTLFLEILTLAGSIFLLYAALLLICFTVIYLIKINTQNRTEWVWPSEKMSAIYYQSFLANLILCLLSAIVILESDGRWTVVLISLIAFTGIFTLALRLKFKLFINKLDRAVKFFRIDKLCAKGNRCIWNDVYIWNMVLLLVLVGVLPAVAFFKVAYNEEMKLFVKHGQIIIAQGLQEREARVRSQYSTERVNRVNNPPPIKDHGDAEKFIKQRLDKGSDVYDDFFFGTTRSVVNHPELRIKETDSVLDFFNSFVPFFNQTSVEIGGLTQNQAADKSWQWEEQPDGKLALHISKGNEALHITTPLQHFGALPLLPSLFLLLWAAGFLIILVILFCLTRFVARKVFLLDVDETLRVSRLPEDRAAITQNLFVVQSSPLADQDGLLLAGDFHHIDLATESMGEGWVEKDESRIKSETLPKMIVIDHFEYQIDDPSMYDRKLRLIEGLLDADKKVVIMSSAEPAAYSFGKAANNGEGASKTQPNGHGDQPNGYGDRWADVISCFRKVYFVEKGDTEIENALSELESTLKSDPAITEECRTRVLTLTRFVREECAPRRRLQNIGKEIIGQPEFREMEQAHVLDQILEQAALYYRKIWNNCSEGEKLTLLHLAGDRLLSPNDPDIKSLLRKGLIKRAPGIRLMNETFKRFVLSQSLTGGLELIETQAKKASSWEALKVPLLIVFVGVVLFLFLTQKDFYSSALTVITASTTGIPAFFKLITLVQGGSASRKA
jgi:ABC-type multidrug transport system fused ATPase/permease subunit